ncbi:MAG: methyltransferase domain-containing protein [Spirochaetaceae bacterium]|nr:methyltransferase domain-containing protein [Spirochaetaceae bacterium]
MPSEASRLQGLLPRIKGFDRSHYQARRRRFLTSHVDVRSRRGLEFGGFDLPTVPPEIGTCSIADMRSEFHLATEFGIPLDTVCPVDCIVEPGLAAYRQIPQRFDYVVLCHVLEHIPDVITTLNDLGELLVPGGHLFIALPDKRETPDVVRASTTLPRLVERQLERATRPSMSEIAEFSLAWNEIYRAQYQRSMKDFFQEIRSQQLFGEPDVHCNVWRDEEFRDQVEALITGGYVEGLEIIDFVPTAKPFNEFYLMLRRPPLAHSARLAPAAAEPRSVFYRTCNFCGFGRFEVWKRLHLPFPERCYADSEPEPDLGRNLSLQYLTCRECGLSSINPLPRFEIVDRHRFGVDGFPGADEAATESLIGQCRQVIEVISGQYEFERYRKTGRLLDVSCGPGIALAWLRDERGWDVRGVEPGREFVEFAARRFGLEVTNGLVQDLEEPPGSFDVVMIDASLQYTFDPLATLLACHRLLRDGGCLFLHLPNRDGLATEWIDLGIHWGHWFSFSVPVLDRMLRRIGFRSERILSVQGALDPRLEERLPADFDLASEALRVVLDDAKAIDRHLAEGGRFRADYFGLAARKLSAAERRPEPGSDPSRLRAIADCSHRQRLCVAIDPDTDVWWPWETPASRDA